MPAVVHLGVVDTLGPTGEQGLTSAEVDDRRARGQANQVERASSRSTAEILRANLLTRFNALVLGLAVVVVAVGQLIDLTFVAVMVLNAVIGVVQELRAKRTLDHLTVLVAASVEVVRDGASTQVPVGELVLGDRIALHVGDQVPVDGKVLLADGFEVDESSLTGEADPVDHGVGDEVRSGSAVVAGNATIEATRVGSDAWAHQLESEARQFDAARSELRGSIDRILMVISWMVLPLGALLVWSQLRGGSSVERGLVSAVAGMVALVPQGLVLLVSVTMATAVVRLARDQVVVRELPAVEGLARVDVICLDKTGTLTTGRLALEGIECMGPRDDEVHEHAVHEGLAALAHLETSPSEMFQQIAKAVGDAPDWRVSQRAQFSSARKWSGASFEGHDTWVIGAPEIVLDAIAADSRVVDGTDVQARVDELVAGARRVLLVATTHEDLAGDGALPSGLAPVAIVTLSEQLRPDAAQTMKYFLDQGVAVKIISGDSAQTVSAIAAALGVPGADKYVDMRHPDRPIGELVDANTVFGRVLPDQKRELVQALQAAGHTVAMTGDGVNDIPALKAADIAIAMDTATPSTKAVAELVLLNGRFDLLPGVVAEGRRVIANMERVSALFVTKTVYATLFALSAGITGHVYPFLPRHLALIADLTIGAPAFVLGFRPTDQRCRPGYLRRVVRFSVPAGVAVAAVTLCAYGLLRSSLVDSTLDQARTGTTLTLAACSFWILYRLIRPLDRLEAGLLLVLMAAFALVFAIPPLARVYALHLPTPLGLMMISALTIGSLTVLQLLLSRVDAREKGRSVPGRTGDAAQAGPPVMSG